jgi:predicted RNA-binding Zn-ribbon protein involved in translation (DUF1610 family)
MSNILKNMVRVVELTKKHFECPDCDNGLETTNDRCKTCHGTSYWACDTDFELRDALVELRDSMEVNNAIIANKEEPHA